MATRTIYLTVRLDLSNPDVDEITDDDVEEIVSEVDYEFRNYGNYEIESEICGQNDEGGLENTLMDKSSPSSRTSLGPRMVL